MALGGTLTYQNTDYLIGLDEQKNFQKWMLLSKTRKEDLALVLSGGQQSGPNITLRYLANSAPSESYILEMLHVQRYGSKLKAYRNPTILTVLMKELSRALSYTFAPENVLVSEQHSATMSRTFVAQDENISISYEKKMGQYVTLSLTTKTISLELSSTTPVKFPRSIELTEVKLTEQRAIKEVTVEALNIDELKKIMDLSWYFNEDGTKKKNYFLVQNIKEFEDKVMTPLIRAVQDARSKGIRLEPSLDVETSGLNMYNLSPTNPLKDKLTAVIISWEDDASAIICVGMDFFDNVPVEYVMARLKPLCSPSPTKEDMTIEVREVVHKDNLIPTMTGFEPNYASYHWRVVDQVTFNRKDLWWSGHNVMFDGRSTYCYGLEMEWGDDTLQLAFLMFPRVVRGSNKLKFLLEVILGIKAPELSDLLGKGNEGMYHRIRDPEVAAIYGGSDTDNQRKLRRELLRMMPKDLYKNYLKFDRFLLNHLPKVEYEGLPIDTEFFRRKGEINDKDMQIMREFLYRYVGEFLSVKNKRNELYNKFVSGIISEEDYNELLKKVKPTEGARYEFKLSGNELRTVLYDILNYPVMVRTKPTEKHPEGQKAMNKLAFKKWKAIKRKTPGTYMKSDLLSSDGKTVLLEAEKFNALQYPISYFLEEYKSLDKDDSGYYRPVLEGSMEGRLHKSFSLARIETLRIMNSLQTMKAPMKYGVVPLGPDWYMCDFDQKQAEPRIMISRSDDEERKERFRDPENDYHTETAANIIGVPPHTVPADIRREYKTYSLGIPYGIGEKKMCEGRFGDTSQEHMYQIRKGMALWEKGNAPIFKRLMEDRMAPLTPAELPDGLREFIRKVTGSNVDVPYGKVENDFGFYRLFDLSKLGSGPDSAGKIMRPAGNYPIQSLAAGIFRIILKRLLQRLKEEGLLDKVKWHLLIHDELLMSVHKSVHPILLYKILFESCTITLPGHTTYFIDINIGYSWGQCKEDESEAPVRFVEQMVNRWDAGEFRNDDYINAEYTYVDAKGRTVTDVGPRGYVMKHMYEYFIDRIGKMVLKAQPDALEKPINLKHVLDNFTNYTVRAYVTSRFPANGAVDWKTMSEDEIYEKHFETWMIKYFGEGKELIGLDGTTRKVFTKSPNVISSKDIFASIVEDEDDISGIDEEDWSFEDDEYNADDEFGGYVPFVEDDPEYAANEILSRYDTSLEGTNLGHLIVDKPKLYDNVELISNKLYLRIGRKKNTAKVKEYLMKYKAEKGYTVVLKSALDSETWVTIDPSIDLEELNEFLRKFREEAMK